MRIVFWGSSDFSMPCLEAIHPRHEVVAVVTNLDKPFGRGQKEIHRTPVKIFAQEHGIPVLQPLVLKDPVFDAELRALSPDLSVIVSYGKIIPEALLYVPRHSSINVHASVLPKYRGASPIQAALEAGDTATGNTVQFVTRQMDKGDVIAASSVTILPGDDYETLWPRLAADGAALLLDALCQIGNGTVTRKPQSEEDATYCRLIEKENGRISFAELTAREIYNRFRAYRHWPGVFVEKDCGEEDECRYAAIFLTAIEPVEGFESMAPGVVAQANRQGFVVRCREGAIRIDRIKPAGKKDMDFASYINGYRPEAGKPF
jgi:methionyl-tRNA formyltransferase